MKKGSLSLSMNAIVILILAITLLGLGLSFMRGLFKEMTAKVGVAVSSQDLVNPPTTDNPITLAPSKLNLREGESGEVIVAFMNVLATDGDCDLDICQTNVGTGSCSSLGDGLCEDPSVGGYACDLDIVYNPITYNLKKDQINSYTLAIYAPSGTGGTVSKTYLYTAQMCCDIDGDTTHDCDDAGDGMFTKDLVVIVKP